MGVRDGTAVVGVGSIVREESAAYGRAPRLLDRVREEIRVRHMSWRTEKAYVGWIR
jgi:hypothetical protein